MLRQKSDQSNWVNVIRNGYNYYKISVYELDLCMRLPYNSIIEKNFT